MNYKRDLQDVLSSKMHNGKVLILIGARQVGKTTLFKELSQNFQEKILNLNCDESDVRALLSNTNLSSLKLLLSNNKIIFIDEAQRITNIGLTLKLIADNFKDIQLLVTGSSSFDLQNTLNEPLTGRKFEYNLYPISTREIYESEGLLAVNQSLENRLIYGSYPEILTNKENAKELLLNLSSSYLYKDLLALENIRKPALLEKLLVALALQVGSEVSYNELGQTIGTDNKTIEKYVDLLEKCFVIFKLDAFNRNIRTELKKGKKIYFWDNGVRNAILQNFAPIALRNDAGALWENFFISERLKKNAYDGHNCHTYFWRTTTQQEIDFIEEADGKFQVFEMKWNPKKGKAKIPEIFSSTYDVKTSAVITPENYLEWLLNL